MRDRLPPSGPEEIHQLVNLYDGEIAYLDQELGRFFAGLKEAGIYHRSLIILTADHGESFYEHNAWEHMGSLFEEVTHIPLIVKWPGESPTGTVESLVSQLNIFPPPCSRKQDSFPHTTASRSPDSLEKVRHLLRTLLARLLDAKEGQGAAMKIAGQG